MMDPYKNLTRSRLTLVEKEACITLSAIIFELEGIKISCLASDERLIEELERKFTRDEGVRLMINLKAPIKPVRELLTIR